MVASKITTPREFFDHVVTVDVSEFLGNSLPDLRQAYHACISLLSLRDWIVEEHRNKAWSGLGAAKQPFATKSDLQGELNKLDQRFAIVRDIANATKHMTKSASTQAQYLHGGPGGAPIGAVPIGGVSSLIFVQIGNKCHDVKECVRVVHNVWLKLLAENSW